VKGELLVATLSMPVPVIAIALPLKAAFVVDIGNASLHAITNGFSTTKPLPTGVEVVVDVAPLVLMNMQ
jgi:hypothetical protein